MKFEPIEIRLKDNQKIILREATFEDAEQLRHVTKEYVEESEYIPYVKDEFNISLEDEQRYIQSFSDSDNSILLLAVNEGKIIGCMNINGENRQMMRHGGRIGIGMLKKWRGKGVGTALFEYAIKWAKEKSPIEILSLETFSINKTGQALYRKFGFEQTGTIPRHIKLSHEKYADSLIMSLIVK